MHATLDEFLDRQRSGLASTYLTRLEVGQRLVDAAAVPTLYSRTAATAPPVPRAARRAGSPWSRPSPPPRSGQEWLAEAWAWLATLRRRATGWLRVTLVRRHLVGAVALVLALAIGIALGGGPLQPRDRWSPPRAEHAPRRPAAPTRPTADDLAAAVAPTPATAPGSRAGASPCSSTPGRRRRAPSRRSASGSRPPNGSIGGPLDGRAAPWSAPARWRWSTRSGASWSSSSTARWPTPSAAAYERMGQLLGTAIASRRPEGAVPGAGRAHRSGRASTPPACSATTGRQPRQAPLVLVVLGDDLDDDVRRGPRHRPRRAGVRGGRRGRAPRQRPHGARRAGSGHDRRRRRRRGRPAGRRAGPEPGRGRSGRFLRCVGI